MQAIYIIIFLKNKKTNGVKKHVKTIETFPKKRKTKGGNMLAKDIEIFLKSFNCLWNYKKLSSFKTFGFFRRE